MVTPDTDWFSQYSKTAHFRVAFYCGQPKGAFTRDANEALSASDLHVKSMQRCE